MDFKWITLDNIILGYTNNFKKLFDSKSINKIILFDLDNTLIKTKSKKVFPINKYDWEFIVSSVPDTINEQVQDNNVICGIITNQKGLKSELMVNDWIFKIKSINEKLQFHVIFASIKDDNFRKPLPQSWDYIKNNLLSGITNLSKLEKENKIYYIGDACGRTNDFSDTDLKYSINCGFKFKTPELFFKYNLEKPDMKNCYVTYPEIPYYTKEEQDNLYKYLFSTVDKFIKKNEPIFIMMIGFPASGKSFLRKEIVNRYPQFKYTNNDDINDKIINDNLVKSGFSGDFVIEDNTNLNLKTRSKLLNQYGHYNKIGIFFDLDYEVLKHLMYTRMYWFGVKPISQVVYRTLNKSFVKPEVSEGFDSLICVNQVFSIFNMDNKIKYYF